MYLSSIGVGQTMLCVVSPCTAVPEREVRALHLAVLSRSTAVFSCLAAPSLCRAALDGMASSYLRTFSQYDTLF